MKVLYISQENTVGTLNLWKKIHSMKGNSCKTITLYESKYYDNGDYCLKLPLIQSNSFYMNLRHKYYRLIVDNKGDYKDVDGYPPTWTPNNFLEYYYFKFRDWLWHYKIEPLIEKLDLYSYDVYHFEWGLEFYRDARFVKKIFNMKKPIICTYHGQDMRTRGVLSSIDTRSSLNLTSELDLLNMHPNLEYLFLPFDTSKHNPNINTNRPIRVCHSPTNRYYKGSDDIISICQKLHDKQIIKFVLIENIENREAQRIKESCDILIDQIYNRGGWGYGMNSVEALSMGLCCLTELVPEYEKFVPDHPFINININNLADTLERLSDQPKTIVKQKQKSRNWVVKYHDIKSVANNLYSYYRKIGINE